MIERTEDATASRPLRLTSVDRELSPAVRPDVSRAGGRFERPSAERSEEVRRRRHRERAIAAWLRDLSR